MTIADGSDGFYGSIAVFRGSPRMTRTAVSRSFAFQCRFDIF
jgi:hypothetical protein